MFNFSQGRCFSISLAKVVLFLRICKPYLHLHTLAKRVCVKISGLDGGLYTEG